MSGGGLITLSVVSHGHGAMLTQLLADLDRCESLSGARVIITLNLASEAFDARSYHRIDPVIIRNIKPLGFGANHNAAFKHCTTPWFAVLNPDLRIASDIFPVLLAAGTRNSRIGAVSPAVIGPTGSAEDHVRGNLSLPSLVHRMMGSTRKDSMGRTGPFFWLAGMFILFRTSAYNKVGGFDQRYFLYCEDYDICARLYLAGHALMVEPSTRVVHHARRDSHRSLKHLRLHITSLLKVWCSRTFWRVTFGLRG